MLGAAAIVGHVFPVISRFRGGKGVATGAGVMAVLHPLVTAGLAVVWIVAVAPDVEGLDRVHRGRRPAPRRPRSPPARRRWELAATIGLCVLVMARHLGNIKRLRDPEGAEAVVVDVTRRRD